MLLKTRGKVTKDVHDDINRLHLSRECKDDITDGSGQNKILPACGKWSMTTAGHVHAFDTSLGLCLHCAGCNSAACAILACIYRKMAHDRIFLLSPAGVAPCCM
eukprot:2596456-Amphidinium_carterae.2